MLELINMDKLVLTRIEKDDKQTLGFLSANGKEICKTLELADKGNQRRISCIPLGTYKVIPRFSEKYKKHFHVTNVPGRDYILIHKGNYHTDILGCILVGLSHAYINKDAYKDVASSGVAMTKLLKLYPKGFELEIIEKL